MQQGQNLLLFLFSYGRCLYMYIQNECGEFLANDLLVFVDLPYVIYHERQLYNQARRLFQKIDRRANRYVSTYTVTMNGMISPHIITLYVAPILSELLECISHNNILMATSVILILFTLLSVIADWYDS